MQFTAYPSTPRASKPGMNMSTLWRVQGALHSSDSIVLPCSLLLAASSLVVYAHATEDNPGRNSIRNFFAKILVSMLPVAFLERQILRCSDPVGLFSRFSGKVLLMHACFLGLRIVSLCFKSRSASDVTLLPRSVVAFAAALVLLPAVFGFRPSRGWRLREYCDAGCLVALCTLIAFLEVFLLVGVPGLRLHHVGISHFLQDVAATSADYVELLAFVPAVWMASREASGEASDEPADVTETRRRALWLFAFLVGFYTFEDIVSAVKLFKFIPFAAAGHVAHYLLLVDCAAFLLAHLYDPQKLEKLRSSILSWVADACAV